MQDIFDRSDKMRKILVLCFILFSAFALQACGSEDYSNRAIRFNGETLEWDGGRNESYTVRVNQDEILGNSSSNSTVIGRMDASFSVEIIISKNNEEQARLTQEFTYLPTVTSVELNADGEISWEPSPGATRYAVSVNNTTTNFTSTRFTNELPVGIHAFIIKPLGPNESFFSYPSNPFEVRKLAAPQNIEYTDGVIRWDTVQGNRGYEVFINNDLFATTNERHVNYFANDQSFDIRIRAVGNENNLIIKSALSERITYLYLDTPRNLRMEEGILVWDRVSDATGYELTVDGVLKNVTDHRYEELEAGVVSDVRIKAVSSNHRYFSNWSPNQTFSILRAPSIDWNADLTVEEEINQNILWDTVLNAYGYLVELTKPSGEVEVFNYGQSQRVFGHPYDQVGTYTVRVRALSDPSQTDVSGSRFSNAITIERLAAPTLGSQPISSDPGDLAQGFNLQFNSVQSASGYKLLKEGQVIQESGSNSFRVLGLEENSTLEEQEITFKLISTGNVSTVGGQKQVTLNSLLSDATSFTITILATPQRIEFSGFMAQWEQIQKSSDYTVRVGGTTFTSTQSEHNLDSLEPGSYNFSVIARGDGRSILPSNESSPKPVQRLEPPINLRISTQDVDEGELSFDSVANALSYQVIIGHNATPLDYSGLGNISDRISTNGTPVMVIAVANYLNQQTGVYMISSPASPTKQFTKLAPPSFTERPLTNTDFSWLSPSNVDITQHTPLYRVYNHNLIAYNTGVSGRTMNIESFEPGTYTFYVRAIGDGINFINSDLSSPLDVQILPPVTIDIVDDGYQWQAIPGATSYEVYVDGQEVKVEPHIAGKTYRFEPTFTELKTYKVEIIARGNNGISVVDSKPSIINQLTRRLNTPAFSFEYSHEAVTAGGTINITVTTPAPNARGYTMIIGGATHFVDGEYYEFSPGGPGDYTISVIAQGGAIVDEIYYINSLPAGGTSTTTLSLLGTPSVSSIVLTLDGRLSWGNVTSSTGYEYDIEFDDGTTLTGTTTRTYLDLDLNEKSSVIIRLRARGGGNVIHSDWVTITRNLD